MDCDICGKEINGYYSQYWESGVTMEEIRKGEKLLLSVHLECDTREKVLDVKNKKTEVLRAWIKKP